MSQIPTVEYGPLAPEALSPRLILVPAESPEPREIPPYDDSLEAYDNHVGGCLRGVLFALVFQAAVFSLCLLGFRIWRMMH